MNTRLIILIIGTFLSTSCQSLRDGELKLVNVEEIDPTTKGKRTYTAYEAQGGHQLIKHGLYILRYPSGSKYIESNYRYGLVDGKSAIYDEEGRAVIVGWYRMGKPWEGDIQVGEFVRQYHEGKCVGTRTE